MPNKQGRSPNAEKLSFGNLKGRVAVISGATRGIGRECALALAREGCNIVIAAKSTESTPKLPGSIYTVADEVRALGADALPFKVGPLQHDQGCSIVLVIVLWSYNSCHIPDYRDHRPLTRGYLWSKVGGPGSPECFCPECVCFCPECVVPQDARH